VRPIGIAVGGPVQKLKIYSSTIRSLEDVRAKLFAQPPVWDHIPVKIPWHNLVPRVRGQSLNFKICPVTMIESQLYSLPYTPYHDPVQRPLQYDAAVPQLRR
jgi:hypothetical protein